MNRDEMVNRMVEVLNSAFEADPAAINALLNNRVPCNGELVEHPHVAVLRIDALRDNIYGIGAMGLLSGCLSAAGLPLIVSKWSEPDDNGHRKMLGFTVHQESKIEQLANS